ncbi:hypothetical protein [Polyangium aurulentum]|uniref:hypothetical protein n=1 Tax=Polyangium aurulentum TaxID=2567896 RepID=UPI00146BF99C|nr:hypothetical protein [Polyangium aurulentum]UQA57140.1 hypothetical protein E8A73_038495 [Polyangium aurulentum]
MVESPVPLGWSERRGIFYHAQDAMPFLRQAPSTGQTLRSNVAAVNERDKAGSKKNPAISV